MKFLRRFYRGKAPFRVQLSVGLDGAGCRPTGRPGRQSREIGGDYAVAPGIKIGVHNLAFRVGPGYKRHLPAHALVKAYIGVKPGNQAFDFAVVKDNGMRLIAEQSAEKVCIEGGEKIAGNVDEVRLYPKRTSNGPTGIVPGQRFVAGDVDSLPQWPWGCPSGRRNPWQSPCCR